jgi:hypothetical protein
MHADQADHADQPQKTQGFSHVRKLPIVDHIVDQGKTIHMLTTMNERQEKTKKATVAHKTCLLTSWGMGALAKGWGLTLPPAAWS